MSKDLHHDFVCLDADTVAPGSRVMAENREIAARIFREDNAGLVRYIRVLLKDRNDALEVAQDAYEKLLTVPDLCSCDFPKAYLYKIGYNLALNFLKKRGRRQAIDELIPIETEEGRSPERVSSAQADFGLVLREIPHLPWEQAEALKLVKFEDLSIDQAAQVMGRGPQLVRRRLATALHTLYEKLSGGE